MLVEIFVSSPTPPSGQEAVMLSSAFSALVPQLGSSGILWVVVRRVCPSELRDLALLRRVVPRK